MALKPTIFVIDDSLIVVESLRWLLESINYQVEAYTDPGEFLKAYDPSRHGCLILDVRIPGTTGLELQEIFLKKSIKIPIIFITAYPDTQMVVRAMKLGAIDFLIKPVNSQTLLEAINKALRIDSKRIKEQEKIEKLKAVFSTLTAREHEVMKMMIDGKSSKQIASSLGISPKTVELHRANLMRKIKVKSFIELVHVVLPIIKPY